MCKLNEEKINSKIPKVSIVVTTFNRKDLLPAALDSIQAQTYKNLEVIVINDGSTDGTEEVLKNYAGIGHIISQNNLGQVQSLNKGWRLSSGKYLSYLSDDDILAPKAIESLVQVLEENPDCAAVYPQNHLISGDGKIIRNNVCGPMTQENILTDIHLKIGVGAVFRRDVYEKLNGWNSRYRVAPDREFWMRLVLSGEIRFLPEVLGYYRYHADSGVVKNHRHSVVSEYLTMAENFFNREDIGHFFSLRPKAMSEAHKIAASAALNELMFFECYSHLRKSLASANSSDVFGIIVFVIKTGLSRRLKHFASRFGIQL